jgi:hypothetical protein
MATLASDSMSHKYSSFRYLRGLLIGAVLVYPLLSSGEAILTQPKERVFNPGASERLSDWILRTPIGKNDLLLGLRWLVPEEHPAQAELKARVIEGLQTVPAGKWGVEKLIQQLPVTGRVQLPATDARWLQANTAQDPVFERGDRLELPSRLAKVVLVRSDGSVCAMRHRDGAVVQDYLIACDHQAVNSVDWAWVAQADGRVQLQAIAEWNAKPLSELSPGSIIWAPPREAGFGTELSNEIIQFLGTQSVDTILQVSGTTVLPQVAMRPSFSVQRDLPLTSNDWGLVGLLQTPTARMAPAGEFRFSYSRVGPYLRYNVLLQPFDALSVAVRYSNIKNRLYGAADKTGTRTLTDKAIDMRLRLTEEGHLLPQLAVGVRDLAGTGLFSGEYFVANKRYGNLDLSVGMGWGNLGTRNNIGNPFVLLDKSFNNRKKSVGMGGTPSLGSYFRGPAALFGGVQYHLSQDKWVVKAEYEGNNYYTPTPRLPQSSPINVGVVYRQSPTVDWTLGLERGKALVFGLSLHAPLAQSHTTKLSDPDRPAVVYRRPPTAQSWDSTARDAASMTGWRIREIAQTRETLRLTIDSLSGAHWDDRIDRMLSVLHRDAPGDVSVFELVFANQGVELSRRYVDRDSWAIANSRFLPPARRTQAIVSLPPSEQPSPREILSQKAIDAFDYSLVPSWQYSIGGPDAMVLYSAGVAMPVKWRLAENWTISGALNLSLVDNYDNFTYTALSNLPRVRTYAREYVTESRINMRNLQLTHFSQAGRNHFYSLYAGYLERSFAGAGAEWLYRPWHSPVALGIDINRVQQRSFNQRFGFDSAGRQTGYKVFTGHATVYWDTGWQNVHANVSVGQYLAKDRGVTLQLERLFENGVTFGAWATKTNVSSKQFGEGSFDKGMYIKIPFDVLMTSRTGDSANLVYHPLIRDGGAKLYRSFQLYDATRARSKRDTGYRPFKP